MDLARKSQDHHIHSIVELGLIKVEDRPKLYAELDAEGRNYLVHVLDTSRDERKRRVLRRNAEKGPTFPMHVSDEVFEMASDMWEPISPGEMKGREDRFRKMEEDAA